MDVCTLIVATTMTLQACWSNNVCHPSRDGTKTICTGVHQIACNSVLYPTYECKRPDGMIYIWQDKNFQETETVIITPN